MVAKQLNIDVNEKILDMRNREHRKPEFLAVRLIKSSREYYKVPTRETSILRKTTSKFEILKNNEYDQ